MANGIDAFPLRLGIGFSDARVFENPHDGVAVFEFDFAGLGHALHRSGMTEVRRGGERDVAFGREQAGGRIEPHPARAGQIDLGPGVQIAEVRARSRRTVERRDVGLKLHQIAGDEAAGETQMPRQLHQQPGAVAARAAPAFERELAFLHARLEAHDVVDVVFQTLIQGHQEVDGPHRFARYRRQPLAHPRTVVADREIGRQIARHRRPIGERESLRAFLEKEIKRVDRDHFGDDFDVDGQPSRFVREHHTGEMIGVGVLLPVDEMAAGRDAQRIRLNTCATMGRRSDAQNVRTESDRTVEAVVGVMTNGNAYGHARVSLVSACG